MKIKELLTIAVEKKASDLHLSVGVPPCFRINGELVLTDMPPLTPDKTKELCYSILNEEQVNKFEKDKELDTSYGVEGLGRFRANIYYQRGSVGAAFRSIATKIPDFEQLGLQAEVMKKFCFLKRGLVLATGSTGSGKSTTLAAIVNHINEHRKSHVISIEDPIEYLFKHKKSIVVRLYGYVSVVLTHKFK